MYGNKDAVKNRTSLKKKMTPSQIEEAQRLARNWKPRYKPTTKYENQQKRQ